MWLLQHKDSSGATCSAAEASCSMLTSQSLLAAITAPLCAGVGSPEPPWPDPLGPHALCLYGRELLPLLLSPLLRPLLVPLLLPLLLLLLSLLPDRPCWV
jgi:hypothetical protein